MDLLREEEQVDALAGLEERILKAVETVAVLKREKESLQKQLTAAVSERDAAQRAAGDARAEAQKAAQELETLRGEQKKVRTRIEKLLEQIDTLSAG